ncbi:LysR substrate-binding domain-containing protein [Methylococcus geothermalis]|uniref:LysR substrate-binding domain-containing protein n=1 Tax=Methylococcus geothermalis TaxID=2681310 RepID=A0A858Q6H5_9GAMM|nr:LysR substrate-binding domain-containing protein [Methylococcus geothermalis]QJD29440.1 hypothetical protein GNH96_05340 [Methylococcus geothermalis]
MPNDFAHLVLAPMLSVFVERYPKVSLEIDLSARRTERGGVPPGRVTANSPELLVRLACQGLGVVAMPDHDVRSYVDTGALTPVLPAWRLPSVTGWAVFAGRRLLPVKTRAFLDMLDTLADGAGVVGR